MTDLSHLTHNPELVALNPDVFGRDVEFDVHDYMVESNEPVDTRLSEHQIQANYFKRVDIERNFDDRYKLVFAIPNGGHRAKKTASDMKREGALSGVLDICISVPSGKYHGAWIETKKGSHRPKTSRAKKGGLSDEQIDFIRLVTAHGYFVRVCYSTDELELATLDYFSEGE